MKKFINNPDDITRELLEGLILAYQEIVELAGTNKKLVINKQLKNDTRVGIVTLGGTGHEPALEGLVGPGMLDICVAGDIFAAPGPQDVYEAIKLADSGKGVLLIVLNHAGDMMTSKAAIKMAKNDNLKVNCVITQEDISNAPRSNSSERRGLVGCVMLAHIVGAASAKGMELDEITGIAQRFADNMATISVVATGATHPATGLVISIIEPDEMEIGAGQHGEGGGEKMKMLSANETAEKMINMLLDDLDIKKEDKLMLVINGSGSTTIMELCIVFRHAYNVLLNKGISVVASYCGEILTTQEQAGFQMSIAIMDETSLELWNCPCRTPYFSK